MNREHDQSGIVFGRNSVLECLRAGRRRAQALHILSGGEDLDEILQLSDRIVVMFDGKLALQTPGASADVGAIGRAMAGH